MMHSSSPRLLTIGAVCIYLFLYAPLLVDRVFPDAVGIQCALEGFTMRWYQAVWQNQHIQEALLVSLMVTIPAVFDRQRLLAPWTALALYRARFPGKTLLQGLLYIP